MRNWQRFFNLRNGFGDPDESTRERKTLKLTQRFDDADRIRRGFGAISTGRARSALLEYIEGELRGSDITPDFAAAALNEFEADGWRLIRRRRSMTMVHKDTGQRVRFEGAGFRSHPERKAGTTAKEAGEKFAILFKKKRQQIMERYSIMEDHLRMRWTDQLREWKNLARVHPESPRGKLAVSSAGQLVSTQFGVVSHPQPAGGKASIIPGDLAHQPDQDASGSDHCQDGIGQTWRVIQDRQTVQLISRTDCLRPST